MVRNRNVSSLSRLGLSRAFNAAFSILRASSMLINSASNSSLEVVVGVNFVATTTSNPRRWAFFRIASLVFPKAAAILPASAPEATSSRNCRSFSTGQGLPFIFSLHPLRIPALAKLRVLTVMRQKCTMYLLEVRMPNHALEPNLKDWSARRKQQTPTASPMLAAFHQL